MNSVDKPNLSPAPKTSNEFVERRKEQRLPAHLPSILLQHDRTIYTTIINLSSTGVGFLSAIPLDTDEQVKITFERKSANTMVPVDLKVVVRSCQETDFEYYIGGSIEQQSVEYTKFFNMIQPEHEKIKNLTSPKE